MKVKKNFSVWKKLGVLIALTMALTAASGLLSACSSGSIELNETSHTMYVSDTFRLTATTSDEDAQIDWASSDEAVATVRNGIVSARAVGKATVTASLEGGASATCEITVLDRTVTISETSITINMDETTTHKLTATSSDDGAVTWSTSDSSVATVSGGTVTAVNTGTATITAQRGAAKATCEVTVIMPSRPADWHELEMMQNAGVVETPGEWYYWADGTQNTDYSFAAKPYYGGGVLGVTLTSSNLDANKLFYFRYQPKTDSAGEELKAGDSFRVAFKAKMSLAGTLKCASGSTVLAAGEETTVIWNCTMSDTQPFYIGPREFGNPTAENPLVIEITEITFTKTTGSAPVEGGLTVANNKNTIQDAGTWHYWKEDSDVLESTPTLVDGTLTLSFLQINAKVGAHQLRYQPKDIAVGTKFIVTFSVTLNRDGAVQYGNKVNGVSSYEIAELTANETKEITYIGTLDGEFPFAIGIIEGQASADAPLTMKVTGFEVKGYDGTEEEVPGGGSVPAALAAEAKSKAVR